MITKKVYCYLIDIPEAYSFEQLLLSPKFNNPIYSSGKTIEIWHPHKIDEQNLIFGIFVATQTKNVPPAHKPGDTDYSAVPLKEDQGLSYPNAFIYSIDTKVLLLEFNIYGVSTTSIIDYFKRNAESSNYEDWFMNIAEILNIDAYKRANALSFAREIELQIAYPRGVYVHENKEFGALEDAVKLAEKVGANKSIKIILNADPKSTPLKKNVIRDLLDKMSSLGKKTGNDTSRMNNKLVIKGTQFDEDGIERPVIINYFVDKIMGTFKLKNKKIHKDLQQHERKEGLLSAYVELIKDIREAIEIN